MIPDDKYKFSEPPDVTEEGLRVAQIQGAKDNEEKWRQFLKNRPTSDESYKASPIPQAPPTPEPVKAGSGANEELPQIVSELVGRMKRLEAEKAKLEAEKAAAANPPEKTVNANLINAAAGYYLRDKLF